MGSKIKGPLVDPGLCRCCGIIKKCRILNVEYEWLGQKEVYSDMFVDCFGLILSHLDTDPPDQLICATCVVQLRSACAFRVQVLRCEEVLLQKTLNEDKDGEPFVPVEVKIEKDAIETEDYCHINYNDDLDVDDVDNDADYTPEVSKPKRNTIRKAKKVKSTIKKKNLKLLKNKKYGKEQLLSNMQEMKDKLKMIQDIETLAPLIQSSPHKESKYEYNDDKMIKNTTTIVQNSFVYPFDSSFSDYFCFYCRESFTDPEKLRDHTETHDTKSFEVVNARKLVQIDVTRIDCRLCEERIDNIDTLKNHLTNTHGKDFHDVKNEFLKFRLTANNLACTECNKNFSFFHALKKHMAEHFGTCICDVCGAHYFEERMLLIHQKTHQRVDENYPCKDCGKIFKSKHSRYLHEAKTHRKEAAYHCSKCDEVFFSYGQRYRHMIDVHGDVRMFSCEHCDRSYDSRKSLREHNRRNHLKIFKHQCDLCDKRFYLPSRLKEHMATHTGERNFRCEYCGKCYPRLRGLKVHLQSHTNEKKYRCLLCNASFTQNMNLKNHMKRQHQTIEMGDGSFQ